MRQPLNGTASPLAGGGFGGYKTGSSGGSWAAHAVQAVGRLQEFVARFRSGENLTRSETGDFLACILDESAPDALIAACLVAFAEKGETVEELVGLVESLRNRMVLLPAVRFDCVDTAGMGASSAKTFNVSTAAAIVAAAADVPIAKHGNGAASSKSGSADVMRALGAHLPVAPQASAQMLSSLGFCFLFAPLHHPALARLAGIRRKLAIRTCFNLAGPLANPAGATRHLLGVSHAGLLPLMADALAELHATHAWVVHGCDGLDEITLSGPTQVAELRDGRRSDFQVSPEDFGLKTESTTSVRAADASASAAIIREVFSGRRDAAHALVVMNAAAAIYVGGDNGTLRECADRAAAAIADGGAANKLAAFVAASTAGAA